MYGAGAGNTAAMDLMLRPGLRRGGEILSSLRHRAFVTAAALVILCAAATAALALSAAPASAFDGWGHDGAAQCVDCHNGQPLNDQTCTKFCHASFKSFPGRQCWSCHAPGANTSSLSTPSAACSQGCHVWDQAVRAYTVPFTHGETPHVGASGYGKTCLDCHKTSTSFNNPNGSPHHSGQTTPPPTCQDCHNGVDAVAQVTHGKNPCTSCHTGMNIPPIPATCNNCHPAKTFGTPDCLKCHAGAVHNAKPQPPACSDCHGTGYQQHAGKVACLTCHTGIAAFHHGQSKTTTQKSCRACHAKKHAGTKVPNSKCATCHKGRGAGPAAKAQHSTTITKDYVCSGCHSKRLHASAFGSGISSCRACHKGKYHAAQKTPSNSVCTACHGRAASHSNGFGCGLCHRSAVHNAKPSVPKIRH
jgi:hypothetical protein